MGAAAGRPDGTAGAASSHEVAWGGGQGGGALSTPRGAAGEGLGTTPQRPRQRQHVHFATDVGGGGAAGGGGGLLPPEEGSDALGGGASRAAGADTDGSDADVGSVDVGALLAAQAARAAAGVARLRLLLAEAATRDPASLLGLDPGAEGADAEAAVVLATAAWAEHVWSLRPARQAVVSGLGPVGTPGPATPEEEAP